jgi:hypothetical protein
MHAYMQVAWQELTFVDTVPKISPRMGAFAISYASAGFIWGGRSTPEKSGVTFYSDMYRVSLSSTGNKLTAPTQGGTPPAARSEGGTTVMLYTSTLYYYIYGGRNAAGVSKLLNWFTYSPTYNQVTWGANAYPNAPSLWGLGFACIGKKLYLYGGQLDNGNPNTKLQTVRMA